MTSVRVHLPGQGPATENDFVAFSRGERVQVCDAFIEGHGSPRAVRLFLPQPGQPPFTVADLPPVEGAVPVLVQASEPAVVALSRTSDRERALEIAAAVAVMRAAWAWDERPELAVIVNGASLLAAPHHAYDRRWVVTVRADAG